MHVQPQRSTLTTHVHSIAAAVLFGFMAGTLCNFATQLKFLLRYDDCLDVRMLNSPSK